MAPSLRFPGSLPAASRLGSSSIRPIFPSRNRSWTLLVIALLICAVGILQIYSVTRGSDSSSAWWKQILYVLGGLVLMWLVLPSDCKYVVRPVPLMYLISGGALLGTYLVGQAAFGSTRWTPPVFGIRLQVSEFVKLVIILLVARYLTDYHELYEF